MAEPMSQGYDQTCGTCQGYRYVIVEKAGVWKDNQVSTVQTQETCRTCGGQGRIGGQSQ